MTFGVALLIAALSGFVALSYEILWYRAFSFASAGAATALPLLLSAYLIGIAEGAWVGRIVCERFGRGANTVRALVGSAVAVNVAGFLVIPALARIVGLTVWLWALPVVGVAAAMMGAILPLASHLAIAPDDRVGSHVSYVFAANIVGSALGSLVTSYALSDLWNTQTIANVLIVAGLALAAGLAFAVTRRRERATWVGSVAAIAVAATVVSPRLHDRLYERLLFKELYRTERFERVVENRHGVHALTAGEVFSGGMPVGKMGVGIDSDSDQVVAALAIPAVHTTPKRVLMFGLGAGQWARVVAGLPEIEDVTIIEVDQGYVDLMRGHPSAGALLKNPKVHVVMGDARRWLARHPTDRFDVVVSNTTADQRAYGSALLSVEFMRVVRDRLNPGGVFYVNAGDSPNAFRAVFKVFPHGLRIASFAAGSMKPLRFDEPRWQRTLTSIAIGGAALFDTMSAVGRDRMARLFAAPTDATGWHGGPMMESRFAMMSRLRGTLAIADDSGQTSWRVVFPPLVVP